MFSLRSESSVVMSVTMFAHKRCSVRLYLQLFKVGFMSYLQYVYVFLHRCGCPTHIVLCFLLCFSLYCVPFVASFSE
jgi:hypothetical protein